jgi:hypothetical protein
VNFRSTAISRHLYRSLCSALLFLAACPVPGARADEPPKAEASKARAAIAALLPREIQLGPQAGLALSTLRTSGEYGSFVKPTAADRDPGLGPDFGVVLAARWNHGITLAIAPHRATYRVHTREETVSFAGNPFPHTLKSNTELSYNVWPLILGMGWFTGRQHIQMQIGAYKALLEHADMGWTVDGEPYSNGPQVHVRESFNGWMLGTEYGYRLGSGELVMGVEAGRGFDTMMDGLKGSITAESAQVRVGYLWRLMRR